MHEAGLKGFVIPHLAVINLLLRQNLTESARQTLYLYAQISSASLAE